jgi:hypothetical protein
MRKASYVAIVAFLFILFSNHSEATESKIYIPCLECDFNQAKTVSKVYGDQLNGVNVSRNHVLYDPVTKDIWTFYYERSFEPEINRVVKANISIASDSEDIEAVNTYNGVLDIMYQMYGGGPVNAPPISYYSSSNVLLGTTDPRGWIYSFIRGNTIVGVGAGLGAADGA